MNKLRVRKLPVIGSKVKIINPVFVTRVGYPKTADDFLDKAERVLQESKLVGPKKWNGLNGYGPQRRHWRYEKLIRAYANILLAENNWGGRERTIHTVKYPQFEGQEVTVIDNRAAKTGKYYSASSSYSYEGDYDYEPAGLADMKHHNLVAVDMYNCKQIVPFSQNNLSPFLHKPWSAEHSSIMIIELENLEKVA